LIKYVRKIQTLKTVKITKRSIFLSYGMAVIKTMRWIKTIVFSTMVGCLTMNAEVVDDAVRASGYTVDKAINVIPRPNSSDPSNMKALRGEFIFTPETRIYYIGLEAKSVADYLGDRLAAPLGRKLETLPLVDGVDTKGHIIIKIDGKATGISESYELLVNSAGIVIKAPLRQGLFYATQTLLQLLPPQVFAKQKQDNVAWVVPAVEIADRPTLAWRGYMLDVSRHFFPKETILRQIDLLALYKINRFHLHLTDDQGWRIEIKKYPKLTEVGSWQILDDGSKKGGFYTQADLREIVEYAKQREIMIIPEIDMPGHSQAALAAYPELSCHGNAVKVKIKAGVTSDNMCPSNEKVYTFIGDVLDEIVEIFTGPYLHIGADEASKGNWVKCPRCTAKAGVKINSTDKADREKINQLQALFVRQVNKMIRERGKTMIGWDEITDHDGLSDLPDAVVQSWRSAYPGLKAAEKGHKVIMSPANVFYLDYPHGHRSTEPMYTSAIPDKYWKGFKIDIMGVECALWSESVSNQQSIDYMTWPRLMAVAELGWTDYSSRSYRDFSERRRANEIRLDLLGVNYQKIDGEKLACRWRPEEMPENEVLEYDISGALQQSGKWQFVFVYEACKGISTMGFEIVQNDKVIGISPRNQTLGWRDTCPVLDVQVEDLDPKARQTLRIKLRRNPKDQGKNLDSMGSVWVNYLGNTEK